MLITNPEALKRFYAKERLWQGIPSLEVTPGGRMFCVFYSGHDRETMGNYVVLLQSDDDGRNWTEPVACAYSGEASRCYDSTLWIDPLGRLWWCWSVMPVNSVWCSICDQPDAEQLVWSEPRMIGGEVMMNRPTVLSDGRWLFPMAVWRDGLRDPKIETTFANEKLAYVYSTSDQGKTFTRLGGSDVPERWYDEHMVVEKKDGRLWMLVRTWYGIGESYSEDGGLTWSAGENTGIYGPCSRFHICRLESGRLLLIYNLVKDPESKDRIGMGCWLSEDDGASWNGPFVLDDRNEVSYPDAVERNGYITIIYDRERGSFKKTLKEVEDSAREILFARVTEEELLQGKLSNPGSSLRNVISKLGKFEGDASQFFKPETWSI